MRQSQRYKICGTKLEAEYVRLILMPDAPVKESGAMDVMSIMKNPSGLMTKMKADALRASLPETLCIPYSFWENEQYKIGDIVNVTIEREE